MSQKRPSSWIHRLRSTLVVTAMVGATVIAPALVAQTTASAAVPSSDNTTFGVATPQLATITDNGTSQAPWNVWQGDSSAAPCSFDQLFPTYSPGASGCPTTTTQYENEANGDLTSITEPNFAVYPGADSAPTVRHRTRMDPSALLDHSMTTAVRATLSPRPRRPLRQRVSPKTKRSRCRRTTFPTSSATRTVR